MHWKIGGLGDMMGKKTGLDQAKFYNQQSQKIAFRLQ
jgi:hypothetical protein